MLLCIDCGNTNTVFALWDGDDFICTFRTSTEWQRTADQYFVWYTTLLNHHKIDAHVDEVIISSNIQENITGDCRNFSRRDNRLEKFFLSRIILLSCQKNYA